MVSPAQQPTDESATPWVYRAVVRVAAWGLACVCRSLDVLLLLRHPRLLRPYLRICSAQLSNSPYRWPRSFAAVHARTLTGQPQRDLVYGETPLVTALYLFRRAGLDHRGCLVDVCAGRGRSLLAARWLGASARGTELLEAHIEHVGAALGAAGISMTVGDGAAADLSDVSHIYANWIGFGAQTTARFVESFRRAPKGARIIVVGRPIEDDDFAPRYRGVLPYSWGPAEVFIVERK